MGVGVKGARMGKQGGQGTLRAKAQVRRCTWCAGRKNGSYPSVGVAVRAGNEARSTETTRKHRQRLDWKRLMATGGRQDLM